MEQLTDPPVNEIDWNDILQFRDKFTLPIKNCRSNLKSFEPLALVGKENHFFTTASLLS